MKRFARLFTELDQTTKTNVKVKALESYFHDVSDEDKLWTIAILSHKRPRRGVTTTLMREWAAEFSGLAPWLFEHSYHIVGDLAETIALVLPPRIDESDESLSYWIEYLIGLKDLGEMEKKERLKSAWERLDYTERFVFNKLLTGGWRMGVSRKLMTRALSKCSGIEESKLAHSLMGNWTPDSTTFEDLVLNEDPRGDISKPYPFYLAYALDVEFEKLGDPDHWSAEYKWDGIRGQLIVRGGEVFVWSRGEELVTDKFPEYNVLSTALPNGTVLDGEILPFKDGVPLPFGLLQTRIGRKSVSKKILENAPVILMAYDLLEFEGDDFRNEPFQLRREKLKWILDKNPTSGIVQLSPTVDFQEWEQLKPIREKAREKFSEGLMLKRMDSMYQSGRKRGDWWKWKVDPLTLDAVLIYAQPGHGRRANLYTDYTFAVRKGDQLIPFAKAYSGLTDEEIRKVDRFIKQNTLERFGPVRVVKPDLVFEIAFEGINRSSRHKSGVAVRFPRIKRWRQDKLKEEVNTIEDLHQLLELYS